VGERKVNKEIKLENKIVHDEYTSFALQMYDVPYSERSTTIIKNNIMLPEDDWSIGVIYGASGTGKTTLLKQFGEIKEFTWDNRSVISNLDMLTPEEAAEILCAVGLSTVPSWLRPYEVLSNGEKFRANLARVIASSDDVVLIDEFTSVVDRNVAKAASFALQKYLRRKNKKVILATCHQDVIEWLNPDWIYNPEDAETRYPRGTLCRPEINLKVFRCKYEAWNLFKQHHYLSGDLNKSAKCFMAFWDDTPVGFIAILSQPHPVVKNAWRASRTVVLPDFQGLRIGVKLSDYMGSVITAEGGRFFSKTIHPSMINYRLNSGNWKETSHSREVHSYNTDKNKCEFGTWKQNLRYCYAFEYIGKKASKEESKLFWEKC
jgi:ABC-type lipoprotein export system ATPase subunit